jgi:hypothetical protein
MCARSRISSTGSSCFYLSSPRRKNIFLPIPPKSSLSPAPSRPERGAYRDRHGRWVRDAVDAAASCARGIAGRIDEIRERGLKHADERCCQRTAKSCGPDAPTLASSFVEACRPYRARTFHIRKTTVAKEPGHRGARHTPLKPLRAGMPGDSGVLVVTRALLPLQSAHEAAGAAGTRHSPRPPFSEGRKTNATTRALRVARAKSCIWNCDLPSLRPGGSQ